MSNQPPKQPSGVVGTLVHHRDVLSADMRQAKTRVEARLGLLTYFFGAAAAASFGLPFLDPVVVRLLAVAVAVAPAIIGLQLTAIHQARFGTTGAALKFAIITIRPALIWAAAIFIASFFWIWEIIPLSLVIIFAISQWARYAPVWPIELKRGEVWLHHYHFRPADQGELRAYPQPPLDKVLSEPLKALGLYQTTRDYLYYDYPEFLYAPLNEAWHAAFKNPTNAGSVGQLMAQLQAGSTPDAQDVLNTLIKRVEAHKIPPFIWIAPQDTLMLAWLQQRPVPVVAKVDKVFTNEGLSFDVEVRFSVLADPSGSQAMAPRQTAASAANNPRSWKILPQDEDLGSPKAPNSPPTVPNADPTLITHMRASLAGAFAATASGVARSVLAAKPLNIAFSEPSLAELRRRLADQDLEGLEKSWGASVQKFTIVAIPTVPPEIEKELWGTQKAPLEARAQTAQLERYIEQLDRISLPEQLREELKARLLLLQATGGQLGTQKAKGGKQGKQEYPSLFAKFPAPYGNPPAPTQGGLPTGEVPLPPKQADPPTYQAATPPHGSPATPPPAPPEERPTPPKKARKDRDGDNFLWIPLERRKGDNYRAPGAPDDEGDD